MGNCWRPCQTHGADVLGTKLFPSEQFVKNAQL